MNPAYPTVEKAYAYVTRDAGGYTGLELLVFEQPTPGTGVQVPKGTVDEGEAPAEAVVRELEEETGIDEPTEVTHLASDRWVHDRRRAIYRRHFFHVLVDEPRDAWDHVVTGAGEDDGMVFSCYFTCPRSVALSRDMGDYVHTVLE
ncbi:NUDIX hydrolase [Natronobiforma cellulositropha]|uniref:NUDIX hydrolase n=1 Tax=Natronobiforma cellulositropha TaxID=1679076 RepID=UPI0021D5B598|nr:NUDIX domain-containing protein [Natronobiforma cellulositropha]